MDEVRPSFQNRSVKTTGCNSTSTTTNAFLPDNSHPNQDPLFNPGKRSIPLVNNRKGSLLPMGPGPASDPSKLRFSISGPGDVVARSQAASRLNRARSLPMKYRYHPSNAMLLSHSTHCRLPPQRDASVSNPACPVASLCLVCCMTVHSAAALHRVLCYCSGCFGLKQVHLESTQKSYLSVFIYLICELWGYRAEIETSSSRLLPNSLKSLHFYS